MIQEDAPTPEPPALTRPGMEEEEEEVFVPMLAPPHMAALQLQASAASSVAEFESAREEGDDGSSSSHLSPTSGGNFNSATMLMEQTSVEIQEELEATTLDGAEDFIGDAEAMDSHSLPLDADDVAYAATEDVDEMEHLVAVEDDDGDGDAAGMHTVAVTVDGAERVELSSAVAHQAIQNEEEAYDEDIVVNGTHANGIANGQAPAAAPQNGGQDASASSVVTEEQPAAVEKQLHLQTNSMPVDE